MKSPEDAQQDQSILRPVMQGHIVLYVLAIFISSAAIMALEMAAARLLAPYIGVSLYSWTAIIGVVLGGLSLGNWLGGIWADRGGNEASAGLALGLAALSSVAILLLLTLVAPWLQGSRLGLLSVSFLYVALLFFVPALLLGVVTPLLTILALRTDARTGHVVGMMHAMAAFGSIVGTFITGYVLIQWVGTQSIILGTAAILGLLALRFLWSSARRTLIALAVMTLGVSGWAVERGGFEKYCDQETSYFCIRVVEMSDQAPFGNARGLVLDHLLHGISHQQRPDLLITPYAHLMDELIYLHSLRVEDRPLRSFFAGGGAYAQPRALRARFADAEIVIAELDPAVTEMARQKLYYDNHNNQDRIYHADARMVLQKKPQNFFDVIVGDVFHDIAIPHHLVTREYSQLLYSRLTDYGMYVLNVVDAHPDPRLLKSIVKTLRGVFPHVQVWMESWPEQEARMTYVISASKGSAMPQMLSSQHGLHRQWYEFSEELQTIGTSFDLLPLLTDDYTPLERLLSTLIFGNIGR